MDCGSTNLAPLSQHRAVLPAHVFVEVGPEGGDVLAVPALVSLDLKKVKSSFQMTKVKKPLKN